METNFGRQTMTTALTPPSIRNHVLTGAVLLAAAFSGFAIGATGIQMPAAVMAGGTVKPDIHRKTVQHLEGGIIDDILVRDGDRVRAGDLLLRLDTTRTRATLAALEADMARQRAREARLSAELALASTVSFPPALAKSAQAAQFVAAEQQIFDARRTAHAGQVAVLQARATQAAESLAGLTAQRDAARNQLESRRTERGTLETLIAKGALPRVKLDELDREIDRLEGVAGNADAQIAVNRAAQSEAGLQVMQARNTYQQTASDSLADVVARIGELAEKIRIATDMLARAELVAPIDGTVQELQVFTRGGVVLPAQPLLDIVPVSERLVVEARIPVTEIDDLAPGQQAELRFPAFHGRDLPEIRGVLTRLSADAVVDKDRNISFYEASIAVDHALLPARVAGSLQPGMPVDVIVVTRARSLADYLFEPVRDMMRGAMTES